MLKNKHLIRKIASISKDYETFIKEEMIPEIKSLIEDYYYFNITTIETKNERNGMMVEVNLLLNNEDLYYKLEELIGHKHITLQFYFIENVNATFSSYDVFVYIKDSDKFIKQCQEYDIIKILENVKQDLEYKLWTNEKFKEKRK